MPICLCRYLGVGALVASSLFSSLAEARSTRTVVLSGQQIPGADTGLLFGGFEEFGNGIRVAVIDNSGNTTFKGMLQVGSGGVTSATQHGLFQEHGVTVQTVVRSGDLAPGTNAPNNRFRTSFDQFSPFTDFSVNDVGEVAFLSELTAPGVIESLGTNTGIWSTDNGNLHLVARTGEKPPGTSADTIRFQSLSAPSISQSGKTSFSASLLRSLPSGSGRFEVSVWSEDNGTLQLVARDGDLAPGAPDNQEFTTPLIGVASKRGLTGLKVILDGDNGQTDSRWLIENEIPSLIAYDGSSAEEVEAGATLRFDSSDGFSANAAGQLAMVASILPDGASQSEPSVILFDNNALSLVARAGTHAPGTPAEATFSFFGSQLIGSAGHVAFTGGLTRDIGGVVGGVNSLGVWSNGSGALDLVAREGSQAPETPPGALFDNLSLTAINEAGQVVLTSTLEIGVAGVTSNNDLGIWAADTKGVLRLIAREGDELEVDDNVFRTISSLTVQTAIGGIGGFNDLGQVAFAATFTDGSSGVFVSDLAAVPEPSSLCFFCVASTLIGLTSWPRTNQRSLSRGGVVGPLVEAARS